MSPQEEACGLSPGHILFLVPDSREGQGRSPSSSVGSRSGWSAVRPRDQGRPERRWEPAVPWPRAPNPFRACGQLPVMPTFCSHFISGLMQHKCPYLLLCDKSPRDSDRADLCCPESMAQGLVSASSSGGRPADDRGVQVTPHSPLIRPGSPGRAEQRGGGDGTETGEGALVTWLLPPLPGPAWAGSRGSSTLRQGDAGVGEGSTAVKGLLCAAPECDGRFLGPAGAQRGHLPHRMCMTSRAWLHQRLRAYVSSDELREEHVGSGLTLVPGSPAPSPLKVPGGPQTCWQICFGSTEPVVKIRLS